MWAPMLLLVILAAVIAIPSARRAGTLSLAQQFESPDTYRAAVLYGRTLSVATQGQRLEGASVSWSQGIVLLGMLGIVFVVLRPQSSILLIARPFAGAFRQTVWFLRMFQSGRVGDYVAWFAIGMAFYGILLLLLR